MANLFFRQMIDEELKEMNAVGIKKLKPKVSYVKDRQVGRSNASRDKKRSAMPPGKRISKSGKTYYEYRRSRSDIVGKKI